MQTKYSQKELDFWLRSYVIRGTDHTPDWCTVERLLAEGANPNARVPGFIWTAVEHTYEMLRMAERLFRKEGWPDGRAWLITKADARRDLILFLVYGHQLTESRCTRWERTEHGRPFHTTRSDGLPVKEEAK